MTSGTGKTVKKVKAPSKPTVEELQELNEILEELAKRKRCNKRDTVFNTEEVRNGYKKHIEFFNAGKNYVARVFLAANRVGKTFAGAYETMLHATGEYPAWWQGRRFTEPTKGWVVGKTSETVRDTIQVELLGLPGEWGTGILPKHLIEKVARSSSDRADIIYVKHKSGGLSTIGFKSYDQGRQAFEGTARHYVWLDEEVPLPIYTECVLRTMTTNGIVYLTFTPLLGLSEVVLQFCPGGSIAEKPVEGRMVVTATWDDAPHLTADMKKRMWEETPPFQRDARSKGIPQLGAGAIYPVPESEVVVDPFEVPKHWKVYGGFDVGWNNTACVNLVLDPDTGTNYVVWDYKRGEVEPAIHAQTIKSTKYGVLPMAIDPASRGRTQDDGTQLFAKYKQHGLDLKLADNTVESGIYIVWELLTHGKLKFFKTCAKLLEEYRMYRRDEKGKLVKEHDHLMDALRYAVVTGRNHARVIEAPKKTVNLFDDYTTGFSG